MLVLSVGCVNCDGDGENMCFGCGGGDGVVDWFYGGYCSVVVLCC